MIELRRPQLADREAVLDLMSEFESSKSPHDGGFWSADSFDYAQWLSSNQLAEMGLGIAGTWVPSIQFVAFKGKLAIGFLSLRLALNDTLLNQGGHIGYSVRPSQRNRGYAKEMLELGLEEARSKNINPVLVTCKETNAASRAVILSKGGQLEDIRQGTERYWISLKEK